MHFTHLATCWYDTPYEAARGNSEVSSDICGHNTFPGIRVDHLRAHPSHHRRHDWCLLCSCCSLCHSSASFLPCRCILDRFVSLYLFLLLFLIFFPLDYDTLGLLFGMMLMVGILADTGFFEYCAVKAYKLSRGHLWRLLIILCVLVSVLSGSLKELPYIFRLR